jgi:hypothetical protein
MEKYTYDRRVASKSDLKPQDLKRGLNIMQIAHPEYGVWFVVEETPKGTWTVGRSSRPSDRMAVAESELLRFWRKAESFPVDEDFLKDVAQIFNRQYAKTRFIMGTPEVRSNHQVIYLKVNFQPHNDARVDSLNLWIGKDTKCRMTVSGSAASEDVETQGFSHVMAEDKFTYKGETAEQLAEKAFDLSKRMD